MNDRRCASCGALLGADAEWCTQCYARVEPPATERAQKAESPAEGPSVVPLEVPPDAVVTPLRPRERRTSSGGETGVRSSGEEVVWDCPTCGTESSIEVDTCPTCGTPFARLLEDPDSKPTVDPDRAVRASLLFPGAGHYVIGRRAEGVARAVVFAFAFATGLFALVAVLRGATGVFLVLMLVALGGSAVLYGLSALDTRRAAEGSDPMVSTRALLFGAVGLMLLTLGLLTVAALSASSLG